MAVLASTDIPFTNNKQLALAAQQTANIKRQTFIDQPVPPYQPGDMWANGATVYVCIKEKALGQNFDQSDWQLLLKYIDEQGLYVGNFSFNQGIGGTLTLGGINNGNGVLIVLDSNGDTIAYLDGGNGGFDTLSIGNLISPSVYNVNDDDQTINVSSNINAALASIPPLNNGNVKLVFQNDISENLDISNYLGDGTIEIDLNGHAFNGNVYNHGNSPQYIYFHDGTINGDGDSVTLNDAVFEVDRCTYVKCENIKLYGNGNPTYGFYCHSGSTLYLQNCEAYNVQEAMSAGTGGEIEVDTCKGLGSKYGIHAFYGGRITAFGSQPGGSTADSLGVSGEIFPSGGATVDTGAATPPAAPPTTKSWSATSADNWSDNGYDWMGEGFPRQGNYGYGTRTGYWFFGSGPHSTLNGKSIKSMRVYVTRKSSGGSAGAETIRIKWHTYASKPSGNPSAMESSDYVDVSLKWGQSAWVTLPSSFCTAFANGKAYGIGINIGSSKANYAAMSASCKLEATYS
ncbi:hypothetical protein PU629_07320 [Pullulanibacillus sp. KACC 23026]|uniref:hypothetical protein n=1 Tax=Pullulanibacillus sp. KACC 23026 TaxID=3028315 RepID=UPI0023B05591|nr:hypothetical protein [Pullulanibacillus sp. KACC 23026]WEG14167.1 hypothetical protein PU629_07320 [Pullulanibacillus sp. KACC 23026]